MHKITSGFGLGFDYGIMGTGRCQTGGVFAAKKHRLCFKAEAVFDSEFLGKFAENYCSHQCLHWCQELSTGQFLYYGFKSCLFQQNYKRGNLAASSFIFGTGDRT